MLLIGGKPDCSTYEIFVKDVEGALCLFVYMVSSGLFTGSIPLNSYLFKISAGIAVK